MKFKLFLYTTLKNFHPILKALHDTKASAPAYLQGYKPISVTESFQQWPSLEPSPPASIIGEIMTVTADDLHQIDNWEPRYIRRLIQTSQGRAWVYLFKAAN